MAESTPFSWIQSAGNGNRAENEREAYTQKKHTRILAQRPKLKPYEADLNAYDMIAAFACQSGQGAEKAFEKMKKCIGIDSFAKTAVFIDPKTKQNEDTNIKIEEFAGLIIQEVSYWEKFTGKEPVPYNDHSELYFEEPDLEAFVKKLEMLYPDTEYANRLMTHSWGQRVVRFYDPDGNLIEVGTPV